MLSQYFSSDSPNDLLLKEATLAVMPLGKQCQSLSPGLISTGIESGDDNKISEVWSVTERVIHGQTGRCSWSKSPEIMCVAYWLTNDECKRIESATQHAYEAILTLLIDEEYPTPFRFWNYLPGINVGGGDEEVYKKFCTGRLNAFEMLGIAPDTFPSASALGHHSDGAVFYVFASAREPIHFNNNKQVNAYEYPREYGISSPSFARATALTLRQSHYLFISGTASIVGHKTVEAGNLEKQLGVTMANIEHLLATANPQALSLSTFKVYVRHPHHVARTQTWLEERYPEVEMLFTIADICRGDLLVEIECFCC